MDSDQANIYVVKASYLQNDNISLTFQKFYLIKILFTLN